MPKSYLTKSKHNRKQTYMLTFQWTAIGMYMQEKKSCFRAQRWHVAQQVKGLIIKHAQTLGD